VQKLKSPFREIVLFNIFYDEIISSGDKTLLTDFSKTPLDSLVSRFIKKYPEVEMQHKKQEAL